MKINMEIHDAGAPNDGLLLDTLKTLFRLSTRVLIIVNGIQSAP